MPELPEVETVIRALRPNLIGRKIDSIEVIYPDIIEDIDNFIPNVVGKTYKEINRYGKFLIFILDDIAYLSHLRMEGKYYYTNDRSIIDKHCHIIFHLDNGYMLIYRDVRKFGRMILKNINEIYTTKPISTMGIDPILNKKIETSLIYDKIKRDKAPIKTILLDQSVICGLGNIYVDEVLFKAKVSPLRIGKDITLAECEDIIKYSVEILSKAIELKGTTIRSYTSSLGVEGGYQDYLLVHTKTNCPICNEALLKVKIGGRSSYYCKVHQR